MSMSFCIRLFIPDKITPWRGGTQSLSSGLSRKFITFIVCCAICTDLSRDAHTKQRILQKLLESNLLTSADCIILSRQVLSLNSFNI